MTTPDISQSFLNFLDDAFFDAPGAALRSPLIPNVSAIAGEACTDAAGACAGNGTNLNVNALSLIPSPALTQRGHVHHDQPRIPVSSISIDQASSGETSSSKGIASTEFSEDSGLTLPRDPKCDENVEDMLERIFTLMRRTDWGEDFLLRSTASADLSLLTAPIAVAAACSAHGSDVSMETTGAHGGALDSDVTVDWAVVPAFCANTVSCGAAISKVEINRGPFVKRAETAIGRYLRDEATGEFLLFKSDPLDPDTISFIHMAHVNSCERDRTYVRFHRGRFFSAKDRTDALLFSTTLRERRFCPVCAAAPAAKCSCALPLVVPAHPLDFSPKNMRTHAGNFLGQSRLRLFVGPYKGAVATMMSRSTITGGCDTRLIQPLIHWAIRARMAELDPIRCSMPILFPSVEKYTQQNEKNVSTECMRDMPYILRAFPVLQRFLAAAVAPTMLDSMISENPMYAPWGSLLQAHIANKDGLVQTAAAATAAVPPPQQELSEEEKRAERKLKRKLKNREAAARSNKKRKEVYEMLQQDVMDVREKHAQLVKRRDDLAAENARLRELLGMPTAELDDTDCATELADSSTER